VARRAPCGGRASCPAATATRTGTSSRSSRRSRPRPNGYGIRLDEIARIWKGGCIIRAALLDEIKKTFREEPEIANLLLARRFREALSARQDAWRRTLGAAIQSGLAAPACAASLAYYDMYRRERLPANLTQAQRDYFGAHTYQRIDGPGTFHMDWAKGVEHRVDAPRTEAKAA
jgi:6-phosphogluconate dehydrogenase